MNNSLNLNILRRKSGNHFYQIISTFLRNQIFLANRNSRNRFAANRRYYSPHENPPAIMSYTHIVRVYTHIVYAINITISCNQACICNTHLSLLGLFLRENFVILFYYMKIIFCFIFGSFTTLLQSKIRMMMEIDYNISEMCYLD